MVVTPFANIADWVGLVIALVLIILVASALIVNSRRTWAQRAEYHLNGGHNGAEAHAVGGVVVAETYEDSNGHGVEVIDVKESEH